MAIPLTKSAFNPNTRVLHKMTRTRSEVGRRSKINNHLVRIRVIGSESRGSVASGLDRRSTGTVIRSPTILTIVNSCADATALRTTGVCNSTLIDVSPADATIENDGFGLSGGAFHATPASTRTTRSLTRRVLSSNCRSINVICNDSDSCDVSLGARVAASVRDHMRIITPRTYSLSLKTFSPDRYIDTLSRISTLVVIPDVRIGSSIRQLIDRGTDHTGLPLLKKSSVFNDDALTRMNTDIGNVHITVP